MYILKICLSPQIIGLVRQMPPFLTIPLLITPFNNAVKDWLQKTVSRGLPLSHPPLNNLSILIAAWY